MIYTLSLNFLENLKSSDLPYLACILFCFTNDEQPAKLAVDKKQIILTRYKDFSLYGDIIKMWIDLLSNIPSSMESINVDLEGIEDHEQMCLTLCSQTKGSKKMIVYSLNSINSDVDDDNCVSYNGHSIRLLDRDEAKRMLNEHVAYNISNSMVAGRDIKESTNSI